jgi:hypothetical protein
VLSPTTLPLPRFDDAEVVVPAPGAGPGNWAGAASAVLVDGVVYLAYRMRRPLDDGRGVSVVIARSRDGVTFEQVAELRRQDFGAESFERPVVLRRPDGGWRVYLSCATPSSKHWWIEAVDADTPEGLPAGRRTRTLAGSPDEAVKDPVVLVDHTGWRMWVCCHPLTTAGHEDRMTTRLATSLDGLAWTWGQDVLEPTPGSWDARGTRVTAVIAESPLTVLYDGRATAEQNWHEVTGLAVAQSGRLEPQGDGPVATSPHADGALRYVTAVVMPTGETRFYFEAARPDGAHDLYTSSVPA